MSLYLNLIVVVALCRYFLQLLKTLLQFLSQPDVDLYLLILLAVQIFELPLY
jgi:hypothetical protein